MALSTQNGLELHHVDVQTAFLSGTLQKEVYIQQPVGYQKKGKDHLVCKLKKSIYELKQSSRCWNPALDSHLSDPCIYTSGGDKPFYIGVYVDDMILACKDEGKMEATKDELSSKFDIKDLGKLSYFLGKSVIQNDQGTWLGQPA